MKNTLKLLIFLSLWHITPSFASASRIALVIGNSQYTQLKPLSNPKNDAQAIGKALRNVGFKLLDNKVLYNLNEMQFLSVIKRFARQAQGTEMALIYYAGHGVQIGSGSYLLPVDIPKNIELIERRGIALDAVLDKLKGKSALNIAIFDACREIPKLEDEANRAGFGSSVRAFGRSHALVGRSQIIAYSTATGEYAKDGSGRHSPYTQALLNQLNTSTLDVRDLFDQVAYDVSVKSGQIPDVVAKAVQPNTYYFRKPAIKPIFVPVSPNAEIAFWKTIQNETNPAYFKIYSEKYPQGEYIKIAQLKIKKYSTQVAVNAIDDEPDIMVMNSKLQIIIKNTLNNLDKLRYTGRDFDYELGNGGINVAYYYLASYLSYEKLSTLIENPVFLHGPHKNHELDGDNRFSFGHYNPEFLKEINTNISFILDNKVFVNSTRNSFLKYFGTNLKVLIEMYDYLKNNDTEVEKSVNIFKYCLETKDLAGHYDCGIKATQRNTIFDNAGNIAGKYDSKDFYGWGGDRLSSFWMRRYADGTHKEMYKILQLFKTAYLPTNP